MPEHESREENWVSPVEVAMRKLLDKYVAEVGFNGPEYTICYSLLEWLLENGYLRLKLNV